VFALVASTVHPNRFRFLSSFPRDWTRSPEFTGAIIVPVTKDYLTLALARSVDWQRHDARTAHFSTLQVTTHRVDCMAIETPPSQRSTRGPIALEALEVLDDLFSECVFTGGPKSACASVPIAALMSAAVRHALPIAPAFGVSATKQGSGNAQVCAGHKPPVLALSDT